MEIPMSITRPANFITADCIVQQVIDRYPEAIPVFARHGMQCVGCYISPFHTITDCAREHEMALKPLLDDLNQAILLKHV
jgi:hybrid cluster-associated redox disulfide protein